MYQASCMIDYKSRKPFEIGLVLLQVAGQIDSTPASSSWRLREALPPSSLMADMRRILPDFLPLCFASIARSAALDSFLRGGSPFACGIKQLLRQLMSRKLWGFLEGHTAQHSCEIELLVRWSDCPV